MPKVVKPDSIDSRPLKQWMKDASNERILFQRVAVTVAKHPGAGSYSPLVSGEQLLQLHTEVYTSLARALWRRKHCPGALVSCESNAYVE